MATLPNNVSPPVHSPGTHLAIWGNTLVAVLGSIFNDTSVLQAMGSKAGYAVAGMAALNAFLHAFTGAAPEK